VTRVLLLEAFRLRLALIADRPCPQEHEGVPLAVGDGLLDLLIERIGHAPILAGRPGQGHAPWRSPSTVTSTRSS